MKVTTLMQIKFHLENGKIIFVKLSDGFGYFSKEYLKEAQTINNE